jgi:hypothetical protein
MLPTVRLLSIIGAVLLTSCASKPWGKNVRFELGERTITVDTTDYSFTTTTTQHLIAKGQDSAQTYLVVVHYKQGVSLSAGKKPEDGKGVVVVQDGEGEIEMNAYASRCNNYSRSDCLEKYVDPEHSFDIIGYVPVTDLPVQE